MRVSWLWQRANATERKGTSSTRRQRDRVPFGYAKGMRDDNEGKAESISRVVA